MLELDFSVFPTMESERLAYRDISNHDETAFLRLRGNNELMQYIPRPIMKSLDDVRAMFDMINENRAKNEAINWVVTEKNSNEMLGYVGIYRIKKQDFRGEIGYMFLSEYHGKGYATEAVQRMMQYAFDEWNFHSLEAVTDPANEASNNVLRRCHFRLEGHFLENEYFNGRFYDSYNFGILRREYNQLYKQ